MTAKVRNALYVIDLASNVKRKIEVREQRETVRLACTEGDVNVGLPIMLTIDEARALAKNLNTIARRVSSRPEGTP